MAWSTRTLPCDHDHHPCTELFHLVKVKVCVHCTTSIHLPLPRTTAASVLVSVPMNVTTLGTLCKRIPTVFTCLSRLISPGVTFSRFTHVVVYLGISFSFKDESYFIVSIYGIVFILLSTCGHLGCFNLLAVAHKALMNTGEWGSLLMLFLWEASPCASSVLGRWWAVMWQCLTHPPIPPTKRETIEYWTFKSMVVEFLDSHMHYFPPKLQRSWISMAACSSGQPVLTILRCRWPSRVPVKSAHAPGLSVSCCPPWSVPASTLALTWKFWLRTTIRLTCWIVLIDGQ